MALTLALALALLLLCEDEAIARGGLGVEGGEGEAGELEVWMRADEGRNEMRMVFVYGG